MSTTPRFPNPAVLNPAIVESGAVMRGIAANGSLPRPTVSMVQLRVGQLFESDYLITLHTGLLRAAGETDERIAAVADWKNAPQLTEAEQAALALVDAIHAPDVSDRRVSDALYADAAKHYDEAALMTLAGVIGQVGFFVPLALIGLPTPGLPPEQQWRA
ncbi:carboxymuconolactone decarboxylase family protein [Glycomyces sp. TRM65418]|uniref:carboxymuconolactone decarboxylase family protein n=1 Tax=Glycomyces sp. TRM65418 TaxID=2867006 RepID=UPI001CE4F75B|nr:carboxymuconolactone decarboxylase family protein [Glycomyces sp. TRM65418]MCC3765938.1 carboxymuconolactone decarboxylase family protein [Glycomyces sp. TRM65418]QZD55520.1 carboxymuconolactone decarboxylase family protein [Glycomyces sp. TRM65418]